MVTRQDIEEIINSRLKFILLVAESSLPASQFVAYRKLILDSFGNNGLGRDLERLFNKSERHGMGRNTLCKEGVHHD
jgi:hypothetical protein